MSFRISVRTGNANETVPTVRPLGKASRTCAHAARQSKDCLRARSLRAGRLRKQCARLRGLFSPHLHDAFDCECAARSAIVRNIRHKPPHCIAQYASGLRTEYRPSAIGAVRVALRRPAVCGGLGPARGFSPSPRYLSPKRPFCAMSCDIACKGAKRRFCAENHIPKHTSAVIHAGAAHFHTQKMGKLQANPPRAVWRAHLRFSPLVRSLHAGVSDGCLVRASGN